MNQLQLQKIKTGDLLLTSFNANLSAMILRIFTFSDFHHAAIPVWIETETLIKISDPNIEEKFFLEYAPGRKLYVLEIIGGKTAKMSLVPYEKTEKFSSRVLHRAVTYASDDRLDKFKKFFKNYLHEPIGFGTKEFLSCWLHPVQAEDEKIFETESCVSFCLIWLIMLGYSIKEQGVPYRSRQLYNPDHLRLKYNQSSLLANKETILKNNVKIMSPLIYFITVFSIIFLFVTMIVVFSVGFKNKFTLGKNE